MTSGAAVLAGTAVLVAGALVLAVAAVRTAVRPDGDVPDRDGYLDRWSELHGGYDPRGGSVFVRGWLGLVHALARPLARRGVQPDVVTLASVWVAALVVALAAAGGGWAVLAGVTVVASGLLDNLDGCVAVLERRTSRWGYVLDSVVDRVSDAAYLLAVVLVGCPAALAAAAALAVFLLEYARARAGNAGGDEVGVVTVAERPTRVLVLAPALALSGLGQVLPVIGAAALLVLTAGSLVQLLVVVRRQLLALPPA